MKYLDEHIKDIVANRSEPSTKKYLCIKDYLMDDGSLAYKRGVVYVAFQELDDEGFFIMPSLYDTTHKMNTEVDFYDHFSDVSLDEFKDIVVNDPKIVRDSIVSSVIDSFNSRSEAGFKKYGTNLDRKDLSFLEWINHLQQELQDAILYAEKLKQEHNEQKAAPNN